MDDQRRRDDVIARELNRAFRTTATAAPGESHLDAEAAAAWMDRRLDAGAAQSIEAHLAACAECQALVATLARISPAPDEEAAAGAGAWSWWRRPWLVPAAAAAALAIVVWVSQAQHPAPAPEPESTQARVEEKSPQQLEAEEFDRTPKTRSFQDQARTVPGSDTQSPGRPSEQRRVASTPAAAGQERQSVAAAQPAAPAAADRAANEAAGQAAEQPALDAPASTKATVAGATPAPAPPAAAPPAPTRQESSASAAPRVFRETARVAGNLRAADLLVVAADGTSRWRRAGMSIEFAAGATAPFAAATLPLDAGVLTAGSSPAGTVCWLVGRAGAVLTTTDGLRFARVNPPAAIDLVSVAATDARSATVTTIDGRRFRTADQGATWAALPEVR